MANRAHAIRRARLRGAESELAARNPPDPRSQFTLGGEAS